MGLGIHLGKLRIGGPRGGRNDFCANNDSAAHTVTMHYVLQRCACGSQIFEFIDLRKCVGRVSDHLLPSGDMLSRQTYRWFPVLAPPHCTYTREWTHLQIYNTAFTPKICSRCPVKIIRCGCLSTRAFHEWFICLAYHLVLHHCSQKSWAGERGECLSAVGTHT